MQRKIDIIVKIDEPGDGATDAERRTAKGAIGGGVFVSDISWCVHQFTPNVFKKALTKSATEKAYSKRADFNQVVSTGK